MFPEGKVNLTKTNMRLKWGVGRLIADCVHCPNVYPMWLVGFDDVLPNKRPYIPRIGNKVTILFGDSIDFRPLLNELREKNANPTETRKAITDRIQTDLYGLRTKAEKLHKEVWKGRN